MIKVCIIHCHQCTYLSQLQILDLVHEEERGCSGQAKAKDERRPDQSAERYVSPILPNIDSSAAGARVLTIAASHRPDRARPPEHDEDDLARPSGPS